MDTNANKWLNHGMPEKMIAILSDERYRTAGEYQFLSAYQLAIALQEQFPDTATALGKPLGGEGSGEYDTLARYLAMVMIRFPQHREQIEHRQLSSRWLNTLVFNGDMRSTHVKEKEPINLFRYMG